MIICSRLKYCIKPAIKGFSLSNTAIIFFLALHFQTAQASNIPEYDERGFLHHTMNGMGFEFEPFKQGGDECISYIQAHSASKIRICEIGGCYGRLMRKIFGEVSENHRQNLVYEFVDLEEGHVAQAKSLFQAKFNPQNVIFIASDASIWLKNSAELYDVIIVFNVFHYLMPTDLVKQLKLIREKLQEGGKLFGSAMTPYYNVKKETITSLQADTLPFLPEEEFNRQVFSSVADRQFPGCFCDRPFGARALNFLNKVLLEQIFTTLNFSLGWIKEFSITDLDYIASQKRWVSFMATKDATISNVKGINTLFLTAIQAEQHSKSISDDYLSQISSEEIYTRWVEYINMVNGKNIIDIKKVIKSLQRQEKSEY